LIFGAVLASLRVGPVAVLARAAAAYVTIVRNTPLLMIFVFMAVAMPRLGYTFKFVEDLSVGDWSVSAFFFRSCLALSLYTSAFVCEAFRSGINAVPLGQAEASRAIGLTFSGSMRQVILPQAMRAAVPPLTSVQIALLKNTSVAAAFGMFEATARMRFFSNRNADERELVFLTFAIGYVVLVEVVSLVGNRLERRWAVSR
jgi:glutamate transport system permease protein